MSTVREVPDHLDAASAAPAPTVKMRPNAGPARKRPSSLPHIPGYEIMHVLGQGGMSTVYLASHLKLKRRVAIKMIRPEEWDDAEQRARFRREAESIASLQHPNIVQIFEVGEIEGAPFLVLEYVSGGTLHRHIGGRPLSAHDAAHITQQLAEGIQTAHDRQIIHRDLKPANILLSNSEGFARKAEAGHSHPSDSSKQLGTIFPKISDFGLARLLTESHRQTQSGMAVGTPSYMAPEQAAGKPDLVGKPADIYGLGAILYQMLTGRPPFEGDTVLETVMLVRQDDPVPPSQINRKVPRDLETICLKCLEKEPSRRYASARELALDLNRFLNDRPVKARPIGVSGRLWKWTKRRPSAALATACGLLLVFGVFAYAVTVHFLVTRLKETNAELKERTHQLAEMSQKEADRNRQLRGMLSEATANPGEWLTYADREPGDVWAQLRAFDAALALNRAADAQGYLERARQLAREATQQPNPPIESWANQAAIHDRAGELHRLAMDMVSWWQEQDSSIRLREWLVERDPMTSRWRVELSATLVKIARWHLDQQSMADDNHARRLLTRRLDVLSAVEETSRVLDARAETHELLAVVFMRQGDMVQAAEHSVQAKSLQSTQARLARTR